MTTCDKTRQVLARLDATLTQDLEAFYQDLHAHPELSFEEHRTAAEVSRRARALGYEVTEGVGRTGVVAKLVNSQGPTVLLRADFDALPVTERTGLPYASTNEGVMHACGHDAHVTCLLGAMALLAGARDQWSGSVLAVFQPAEEIGQGAQAMVDDNLYARFGTPDVILGQHVMSFPAGIVACHPGLAFAATDALKVRMFGRGSHASMPEAAIDPVVMAASTVMRLQTVVSREIASMDRAVVTVGALQAGTKDNVIPDEAELQLNIRTYTPQVRATVLGAVQRIVRGEATAAGAQQDPEISTMHTFPLMVNDEDACARTLAAIGDVIGHDRLTDRGASSGSEDVGVFGTSANVPVCYWLLGGIDPDTYRRAEAAGTRNRDIPQNHSPYFAPVMQPTLTNGVAVLTAAALAWLGPAAREA
ncbi:amidohydrolase [Streptomyces sp. NBC_01221]|uniref:amidohydrolase n=1 Tax=Streptomyces sp. NBC_01221 TaxID=2903782 RepID=UPI0022528408|nr:amidohydrolase [Streptomyces sp. NBC_01221]MCX4792207.1 amidohydrolase [Streptomyces sp. NBC_01221]